MSLTKTLETLSGYTVSIIPQGSELKIKVSHKFGDGNVSNTRYITHITDENIIQGINSCANHIKEGVEKSLALKVKRQSVKKFLFTLVGYEYKIDVFAKNFKEAKSFFVSNYKNSLIEALNINKKTFFTSIRIKLIKE